MYAELPPPRLLGDLVACLWWSVDEDGGDPTEPRYVLPDGCLDVIWVGGRLIVAGADTGPVLRQPGPSGPVAGLRFRVGRAGPLLDARPDELTDQRVELSALWGADADRLADDLAGAAPERRPHVIAAHVERRVGRAGPVDRLAALVAEEIARTKGVVSVAELADRSGVGERQLRRRCTEAIGYAPKTLARIVRFQHALELTRQGAPLATVAAMAGYADQAHLTREVVALSARTPAAHGRGPAGAPTRGTTGSTRPPAAARRR